MLLVFIKQVVEDLLVKEGDAFEIVTRARLKTDNLIDESVRLVGQVGDVLLPLNLLLNVGGIVPNLQLDSVEGGLLDLLETLDGHVNELFGLFLADLVFKEETSTLIIHSGLRYISGKGLSDGVVKFSTLVDNHAHNHAQVCHICGVFL